MMPRQVPEIGELELGLETKICGKNPHFLFFFFEGFPKLLTNHITVNIVAFRVYPPIESENKNLHFALPFCTLSLQLRTVATLIEYTLGLLQTWNSNTFYEWIDNASIYSILIFNCIHINENNYNDIDTKQYKITRLIYLVWNYVAHDHNRLTTGRYTAWAH